MDKLSENIAYVSETVRAIYDKRYSAFSFLPGFANEKKRLTKIFKNIFNKYNIHPSSLNSYLDLGCGFGLKTYILSGFFKQSKGIDFSSKAIQVALLLNDKENLQFETGDIHQAVSGNKADIVTALGLSVLNISDTKKYAEEILSINKNHVCPDGVLIVHSFTDFSGTAPSGWYNHTRKDLKNILNSLYANHLSVQIYFQHRSFRNYFGFGTENMLMEFYKLIRVRKKDYYLIIRAK